MVKLSVSVCPARLALMWMTSRTLPPRPVAQSTSPLLELFCALSMAPRSVQMLSLVSPDGAVSAAELTLMLVARAR